MIIIHHNKKPGQAFLAQFSFPWFAILVFNYFWLPSALAATDCMVVTEIPPTECKILINFYNSTNGPNWSDSATNNWNVTNTPCSWTGITCTTGAVTGLDRNNKNLSGSIPDLSGLTQLKRLNLGWNKLSGSIPNSLNTLTNLQYLNLSVNQLTGSIPDLSPLTQLERLNLSYNQLSGSIPSWINTLTHLQELNLSVNQLTGSIPDLSPLTQLERLNLSYNQLSGSILGWINTLTHLQDLDLRVNQLTGSIPNLSALTQLSHLSLYYNQLSGSIPGWINILTNLQELDLSVNQLTGSIPDLSKLTQLQRLDLGWNKLSGSIPNLSALTQLKHLHLGINQLTASDPAWIGNLNHLQSLTLSGLSGSIPGWISNLTQLNYLSLSYNQLSGSIPGWINTLTNLQELDLSVNQLTGSIPNLSPLTQLERLNLSDNQLSGSILDLSTLTQLNWLFINDNQLCGDIPPSLTTLSDLSKLNIENNHLTTSDPTLIDFLNTNNPNWINQTPCPTIVENSSPSLQPLPPTMNLTINFSGNGQGRVTTEPSGIDCDSSQSKCSHSYETADWIKLIPTAAAGSEFTGWSGYQSDCDDGELFMSGSRSCTVYFERLHFPLTVSQVGQGKVNSTPTGIECGTRCRYQFEINTPITLTTTPAANWQFEKWQGDCDANGVVIMDKEKQCQAVFVTVNPDTNNGAPPTPPSNTNSNLTVSNTQPVVTTAQGVNQTPVKDNNYPVTVPQPNLIEPKIIAPAIPADVLKPDLETDNHEVIPQWVVNPGSHDFGKIPVGNASPAQVITVTNVGQVDLQLGELTVSSDEFILAEACSNQTLSAGNHCTATVSFQPQLLAGVKTAYLTIPIANLNQTTVTVVTLTGNAIKDQSLFTGYPLGHDPIDSPLVTFISPLAAVITPEGVELNWEITATDNNPIAEIHLWRAESVKGNCPADIHQYVQKTAMELANQPHLDYQGTDTACYGLQVIEYNGEVTWYITPAR